MDRDHVIRAVLSGETPIKRSELEGLVRSALKDGDLEVYHALKVAWWKYPRDYSVVLYTSAPSAYDYEGVSTLEHFDLEWLGHRKWRKIIVQSDDKKELDERQSYQTHRYMSGLHGVWSEDPRALKADEDDRIRLLREERQKTLGSFKEMTLEQLRIELLVRDGFLNEIKSEISKREAKQQAELDLHLRRKGERLKSEYERPFIWCSRDYSVESYVKGERVDSDDSYHCWLVVVSFIYQSVSLDLYPLLASGQMYRCRRQNQDLVSFTNMENLLRSLSITETLASERYEVELPRLHREEVDPRKIYVRDDGERNYYDGERGVEVYNKNGFKVRRTKDDPKDSYGLYSGSGIISVSTKLESKAGELVEALKVLKV